MKLPMQRAPRQPNALASGLCPENTGDCWPVPARRDRLISVFSRRQVTKTAIGSAQMGPSCETDDRGKSIYHKMGRLPNNRNLAKQRLKRLLSGARADHWKDVWRM